MGVSQAQATINETDPDVLAEVERLSTNGWVEPRKESAANDTARLSRARILLIPTLPARVTGA